MSGGSWEYFMLKFHGTALAIGAFLIAAPAFAQTTQPAPSAPSAAPAAPGAPGAKVAVSDEEVTKFATAAIGVEKIRSDATVAEADKQKTMLSQIQSSGLTPARFNEIAQAMQSDTQLQGRIQAAAATAQKPAAQ